MLALILYIVGGLTFIAAVALLSLIPKTGVKVSMLILFCLLFIGTMTFLLFRVSGQPDMGSMLHAILRGQTQGTENADIIAADTSAQGAEILDEAAESMLNTFLAAWQNYDGDTMLGLTYGDARTKLENELPFDSSSPVQTFKVENTGIDESGAPATVQITMTVLNDALQSVSIGYTVQLEVSGTAWYVTDVVCDVSEYPTFDLSGTQITDTSQPAIVIGTWVDPDDANHRIEIREDGTCTIYYTSGDENSGTYTFDPETNNGMMIDGTFSLWYAPETDTIIYVGGTLVREDANTTTQTETVSILRMWYEKNAGLYRLEFSPDGSMRYIMPEGPYAGTYTFDAATGQGEVDIFAEIYEITYDFEEELLSFDGLTYSCMPPGEVTNNILGFWYEHDDGLGQLEFFSDGTLKYYADTDKTGTYTYDEATAHGDINISGYTYEIIYIPSNDTLNFEGALYARIPW